MRARLAPVTLAVAIVALAVAPAALAGNGGIAPPDSATASGSQINDLWWILMSILITIFVLVEGALLWFVFRYRRRRGQAGSPVLRVPPDQSARSVQRPMLPSESCPRSACR